MTARATPVAPALVLSLAAAVAATALAALLVPVAGDVDTAAVSPTRYLGNGFCAVIICLGLAGLLYGLLQLAGLAADRRASEGGAAGRSRLATVLFGDAIEPMAEGDPTVRAALVAERWDSAQAQRKAPLGFAIAVLPLLGFIGTVIGISGAIGDLGAVFADEDREAALDAVLQSLRFAFDTTFVGLACVVPIMAVAAVGRARAEAVRLVLVSRSLT